MLPPQTTHTRCRHKPKRATTTKCLFRPTLCLHKNRESGAYRVCIHVLQELYVKPPEMEAVAERIGEQQGTAAGAKQVLEAFRALIRACSTSTFLMRSGEHTDESLEELQRWERESVSECVPSAVRERFDTLNNALSMKSFRRNPAGN